MNGADNYIASMDALKNAAEVFAKKSSDSRFKNSIYFYFIARYFVALHEAHFFEIPVQVWNEYRNALDHYFRHLTSNSGDYHLEKLEDHIHRSVLDITKLFSYRSIERLTHLIEKEERVFTESKSLYFDLKKELYSARECFISAKSRDLSLDGNAMKKREILDMYMKPCFELLGIFEKLNTVDIDFNENQDASLRDNVSSA